MLSAAILIAPFCMASDGESPLIALLYARQHYDRFAKNEEDPLLRYRNALEEQGARIAVIGQGMTSAQIESALPELDGLLLPGGIDVEPKAYGETPDPKLEKTDSELDALEFRLLEHARRHGLPVLGICRGHQSINVFYGGSLIQDIPTGHSAKTLVSHRGGDSQHDIAIEEGAILRTILGTARMQVNTYHHQAVKRLASGFEIAARADDGIVEAIEAQGGQFILGVQFHPEKMLDEQPRLKAIFERFVTEVRQRAARKTVPR